MARPRKPTIIAGVQVDLADAPGLEHRIRAGAVVWYWIASKDARGRGYVPRTVRLHGDNLADIKARARVLQQEMARWLADPAEQGRAAYDGTLGSLVALYQTEPSSPYRACSQNTRRGYDDWCKALVAYGKRRIDRLTGADLRRWYNEIAEPRAPGEAPRIVLARKAVRTMLMILLNYGAELALPGCLDLVQVLERMTLRVPDHLLAAWKAHRPEKVAMTFAHASAIVAEGLRRGTRKDRSVALGVAAQFEFTVAQVDVIGAWERIERPEAVPAGALVRGNKVWRPGLCYEDFLPGMVLDLTRSKNDGRAIFDVKEYPLFLRALAAVPEDERRGPVAIDAAGLPFKKREYQKAYRAVADAAGVPAGVWNMLARHGGGTEADQAGVPLSDTSQHLQHSDLNTTKRHYIKPTIEVTRRVQRARVASRKESA